MIPDHVVAEVKASADIVGIIGQFVNLKRAGKEFKGLSPFKKERTPSFFVNPAKGFFHDFSADVSGDVFAFLMKHAGMDFTGAVKYVAARSGITVQEVKSRSGEQELHRPYYEATAFANSFFQKCLRAEKEGRAARKYLKERGLSMEMADEFGLGYAPDSWEAFQQAAARHKLDERVLLELGLLKSGKKENKPYDFFRHRLIFPIEAISGKVVAFNGRNLGAEKEVAKYINSPESPIFKKRKVLYGLRRARNKIRREEAALIVEGPMDVVSLAGVGIDNVVAPLGSALSDEHADLLSGFTKDARLIFDNDRGGREASFRAADILLAHAVHPSVVTLPDGEDPDSVARNEGAEGMFTYLGQAVDVLERKVLMLEERGYFSSIDKTRNALDKLLPTLRAVKDPSLRDIYLARVSECTKVSVETLIKEMKATSGPVQSPPTRQPPNPLRTPVAGLHHQIGPERDLLVLLLRERGLIDKASERIGPADLEDRVYRVIFEEVVQDPDLQALPEGSDASVVNRFEELMNSREPVAEPARILDEVVAKILGRAMDQSLEVISDEIKRTTDENDLRARVAEKESLVKERNELGVDWSTSAKRVIAMQQTTHEEITDR